MVNSASRSKSSYSKINRQSFKIFVPVVIAISVLPLFLVILGGENRAIFALLML